MSTDNVCYICEKSDTNNHEKQIDGTTTHYHTACMNFQHKTLDKYGLRLGMRVIWEGDFEMEGSILCINSEKDGDGHFLSLRNKQGGVDEVPMSMLKYKMVNGSWIDFEDDASDITRVHNDIEVSVDPENVYRMILACTNSQGEPDFAFVKVKCTSEDCDEYEDKSRAIQWAEENDYEAPFVVFNCTLDSAGKAIEDNFKWETASVVEV